MRSAAFGMIGVVGAAGGLAILGHWAAGRTFGSVLWLAWALPALAALTGRQGLPAACRILSVNVALLFACVIGVPTDSPGQWLRALVLLEIFTWLTSAAATCRRQGAERNELARDVQIGTPADGNGSGVEHAGRSTRPFLLLQQPLVVFAWTAWLTVPVWLQSPAALATLSRVHPLITLNGVYPELGDWTHQAIAYRWLTRLGQDTPYTLPESIWPCVFTHATVLLVLQVVAQSKSRDVPRGTSRPRSIGNI